MNDTSEPAYEILPLEQDDGSTLVHQSPPVPPEPLPSPFGED